MKKFKETYLNLKKKNLSDREVCKELLLSKNELYCLKKVYDLLDVRSKRKNHNGLTEEMLQKGESIGLTRRVMYKRVRDLLWSPDEAVNIPPIRKKGISRKQL